MRLAIAGAGLLLLAAAACRVSDEAPAPTEPSKPVTARGPTDPLSKTNPLPPSLEARVRAFQGDLEARGYEIARGYWTLWGVEDCKYPLHVMGLCYGNNPTAPYVMAIVPPWQDEFVDQSFQHALTQARHNMSATYRLSEREALVVLAEFPPSARYFGMQSNVFSRQDAINPLDPIYLRTASDPQIQSILFASTPDPTRRLLISSIGDAINNVAMQRRSGPPWGQQRYFVITSDSAIADSMTAALVRAGVPSAEQIFTERVAPGLVRVGLGRDADDLITYIRYAMPDDSVAGERWRRTLPLAVLRVRQMDASRPALPFPIAPYEQRTWNYDETVLAGDLQALVAAVRTKWSQPAAPAGPFFSAYRFLDLLGQHCLGFPDPERGPMNCLGDTQDTDYQIGPFVHLDDGQVIAVVGTLGTETGNATYVSLSANWFPALVGVANLSDDDLVATAAEFGQALQHDPRLFYVHYFARACAGLDPCLEIPKKLIPVNEVMRLIQRNYINPGSVRGPDPTKLLNPIAITLDGRLRPVTLQRNGR